MPTPFEVKIPQPKLDRILSRVRDYDWFPAPIDEDWQYGTNTAYLKELCAYWIGGFDWRAQEAELNRFPQFVAEIEGLPIHYVHVRGEGDAAKRPLIAVHGWPGSHFEFWQVIPRLAFPSKHGGDAKDAFDVIIPSLPGYGFSGKPKRPIGQRATARLFDALMTKTLGYSRYMAQGGDWGSRVATHIAGDHAACVGAHLNMATLRPFDPKPNNDKEAAWLKYMAKLMEDEGGYLHEQGTKPQTLAFALMDSPVGTAGWILEKFRGWSDIRKGGLEAVFSKDQLLTNIMIYLVTDSIATSVWYYWARLEENIQLKAGERIEKPIGIADFQGDPSFRVPPRSYAERVYNVVHWSEFSEGGHFAAMERPDAFVGDVRACAKVFGY